MAYGGSGFPLIDVIAEKDVTIAERNAFRVDAQNSVLERAMSKRIISNNAEAVVRSVRPDDDLNAGAVAYEQWLTAALVASTIYTYVNAALAADRAIVFYGISIPEPNPAISEVRFRLGPAGASQLFTANIQHIYAGEETSGYFSKVSGYDPLDTMFIQLMPFLTDAGGQIVILRGYVAERSGATISGPVL